MFDIGFWELGLIGLVALIVIGPERLPGVSRTVGKWVGKGKRVLRDVKADIDQELKADELQRILDVQKSNKPLQEIIENSTDSLNKIKAQTEQMVAEADSSSDTLSQTNHSVK